MGMQDIIIIVLVLAIVGAISFYLYRQKKKGSKCLGCPYGAGCQTKQQGEQCGCK